MSHHSDYKQPNIGVDMSSDDSVCPTPNMLIELAATHGTTDYRAVDYWFGKRYFECVLAQDAFTCATKDTVTTDIDVCYPFSSSPPVSLSNSCGQCRFENTMRQYPYDKAVESFRSHYQMSFGSRSILESDDCFSTLLTLVGTIVRLGSRQDKRMLLALIRKHLSNTNKPDNDSLTTQPRNTKLPSGQALSGSDHHSAALDSTNRQLAQYTIMPKEKAEQEKFAVSYQIERTPNKSNSFKAVITVQESTFEGTGSTKKEAKHQASKEAWMMLGFETSPHNDGSQEQETVSKSEANQIDSKDTHEVSTDLL
ncbi:hypothetical protein H2198_003488 [Neophaeococcomyces mojaviensis]|uniref:Uncharacterized protein n=1 Tax=Neophaeococcomyces mojaviensis TaxID=3383035 RepID=A0ACC3AB47_9EURO|nr:hypothetical protein H2198_003488 [Knufia sp. JES_112]